MVELPVCIRRIGVRFPSGPPKFIYRGICIARGFAPRFGGHFSKVIPRIFEINRQFSRHLAVGAEFIPPLRDFGSGEAEFPLASLKLRRSGPHPPSAMPSLWMPTEFIFCFAKCAARKRSIALAPTHPCAGNDKELPNFV